MRLVTWNTWWFFGHWEQRQPLLAATLATAKPDVVLLQETWPDQAERLAAACGLSVIDYVGGAFSPEVLDAAIPDQPFGNAILGDPAAVQSAGALRLDSPDDVAPRSGVAARLRLDDLPIVVTCTHLNHIAQAASVRVGQLDELRRWTETLAPDEGVLLGGDLNQTPSSPEYRDGIARHWVDLWAEARPEDHGPTMSVDNHRLTYTDWMADRNEPGAPPGIRLDYLLTRARDRRKVGVAEIDLIGGAADDWPSDHLAIVADLTRSIGGVDQPTRPNGRTT